MRTLAKSEIFIAAVRAPTTQDFMVVESLSRYSTRYDRHGFSPPSTPIIGFASTFMLQSSSQGPTMPVLKPEPPSTSQVWRREPSRMASPGRKGACRLQFKHENTKERKHRSEEHTSEL